MSGAVTAAVIGGSLAAAGGIGGAAIASSGANKAAQTQSNAATSAAQLQYQASQDALNFQKQQYATSQQELAPWLQSGTQSLSQLNYLLGIGSPNTVSPQYSGQQPMQASTQPGQAISQPGSQFGAGPVSMLSNGTPGMGLPSSIAPAGSSAQPSSVNPSLGGFGSLMTPYGQTFQAPTGLTEQNDPGYMARLQLGTDALQKSAAARGSVLTGGTAKALDTYAQDYASNEYGNVYNRAYNTFASNLNQYNQNQTSQYNRLASLAGIGQQTAGQLAMIGQNSANSAGNILTSGAANQAQQLNNAAAASASGYAANGNIWGNALSGLGSNLSNLYQMQNQGGSPYQTLYNAQNPNRSSIQPTYSY